MLKSDRWSNRATRSLNLVKELAVDVKSSVTPRASRAASRISSRIGSRAGSRTGSPVDDQPPVISELPAAIRTERSDDRVLVFPGWAHRKYTNAFVPGEKSQFTIDIYVSGYAAQFIRPEFATRAQRSALFAAKSRWPDDDMQRDRPPNRDLERSHQYPAADLASLPKLVKQTMQAEPDPPPIMIHLTPSTEELLATKKLPPRPSEITDELERIALAQMYDDENVPQFVQETLPEDRSTTDTVTEPDEPDPAMSGLSQDQVRQMYLNLHTRLRQFWSNPLANRMVRVEVFVVGDPAEPLMTQDLLTDSTGGFAEQLRVPWERMLAHPLGHRIALGQPSTTLPVDFIKVVVELLPGPGSTPTTGSSAASSPTSRWSSAEISRGPTDSCVMPVTYTRVRLISDIDDTVKNSEILGGPRKAFRNVFIRELNEVVIPEMTDWYQALYACGVRFHYVSNSPWELLPVISEFVKVSNLPEGSVRLKWYGGVRHLFANGLLEPADVRKRTGVVEVLDSFLDSQFILVGDTGELDMELYSQLAHNRPFQILAVFVRDVTTPVLRAKYDKLGTKDQTMPKKLQDFAERCRRARELIPLHIPFRVFTHPSECGEVNEVVARAMVS